MFNNVPEWMTYPATDMRLHDGWVQLQALMYNTVPGALTRIRQKLTEWGVRTTPYDQAFQIPFSLYATKTVALRVSATDVIIVSKGTEGSTQMQRMMEGWADPDLYTQSGASGAFNASAVVILQAMGPSWFEGRNQFYWLSGHSYGGAQLQALAAILNQDHADATIKLVTYVAPRAGRTALQQQMRGVNHIRIYNDDDPVRKVPPHTDEAPLLSALMPFIGGQSLRPGCNLQVQSQTGYAMHNGGGLTQTEDWPSRVAYSEAGLLAWLTSNTGFASNVHTIEEYQTRVTAGLIRNSPVEPSTPAQREPEEPLTATNREQQQIIRQAVTQLQGESFPAPIPGAPIKLAHARYRAVKYAHLWAVTQDGAPIIAFNGKRKAKQYARRMNRASRNALPAEAGS